MAILKVAQLGHPLLRQKAEPVDPAEITTDEFQKLIIDMIATMREYNGVGLAAPQIHVSKQVAVIEVDSNPRYPQAAAIPLTVLINPEISPAEDNTEEGWEGCLSIPDMRGIVPRYSSLKCRALDRSGKQVEFEAHDFFARVIQHEWDHLQGSVYLDRMPHMRSLSHLSEFARHWKKSEHESSGS